MPRRPAKHENPLMFLQHAASARLVGRTTIFANWQVPDVVPRRTNQGDIPNEDRRLMIRIWWGREEMRIPTKMRLFVD